MLTKKKPQRGKVKGKKIPADFQPEPEVQLEDVQPAAEPEDAQHDTGPDRGPGRPPPPHTKGRKPKTDYRIDDHVKSIWWKSQSGGMVSKT